jgi:hypothetical protein
MTYKITEKEKNKLQKIAQRLTIQSFDHKQNITEYFKIMIKASREEFTEDNNPTLKHFLEECFNEAIEDVGL